MNAQEANALTKSDEAVANVLGKALDVIQRAAKFHGNEYAMCEIPKSPCGKVVHSKLTELGYRVQVGPEAWVRVSWDEVPSNG